MSDTEGGYFSIILLHTTRMFLQVELLVNKIIYKYSFICHHLISEFHGIPSRNCSISLESY
jgi:hypothetical protein